jgi:diguanylate cyclase (GGDEF)-like protein
MSIPRPLIVDRDPINRDILSRRLRRQGYEVDAVCTGLDALEKIRTQSYDLVFLDLKLGGDIDGYQVIEQLKNDGFLPHLPVIVISLGDDMQEVARCIEMGAEDFLLKPLNPVLLNARLNAALEKKRMQDQQQFYLRELRDAKQKLEFQNEQLKTHIAKIEGLQAALREQAIHDPLTGLYNRRHMNEVLKLECARALRKGERFSIVILDLDHLKEINDTYGHVTGGDKALQILANTIKQMCRVEDTLCRYGGDEFLIILYDTPAQVASERALQWKEGITRLKVDSPGGEFGITFSAGVAEFPTQGSTSEETIIYADRALYRAKELGRNRVVV